jgi:hypothetical protein
MLPLSLQATINRNQYYNSKPTPSLMHSPATRKNTAISSRDPIAPPGLHPTPTNWDVLPTELGLEAMPTGTNTIQFIPTNAMPKGRNVTYGTIIVCTIRPQKAEPHRSRLVVGGDKVEYPGHVSTPTAKITTAKCLINSTISTPGARFAVTDLKDFYLGTPMACYEYM